MASSCEEQLLCPICLDAYSDPVSTPCGHNYCRTCITEYWSNAGEARCPMCLDTFPTPPELKVNTAFGDLARRFGDATGAEGPPAEAGEVACDLCPEPKLRAQRSCLGCLASYCRRHLEQHQRVPAFRKHRLAAPTPNLGDNLCPEHDEALKLFCETEQVCVCVMCLRGDHAKHEAVPLESAFGEKRDLLIAAGKEMARREKSQRAAVEDLRSSAERSAKKWEEEVAEVGGALASLVVYLQRSQAELVGLMREKQREAQTLNRRLARELEQEVGEWRRRRSEVERVVQGENRVRLLQSFASLSAVPAAGRPRGPARLDSCVDSAKEAVARMRATIAEEMERLNERVKLPLPAPGEDEVLFLSLDQLRDIKQRHAVDVILDPGSAHSGLLVHQDGKTLMARKDLKPPSWEEFSWDSSVLGKEGFSSGRFYFQVRISDAENCLVGVVSEAKTDRWVFHKSTDGSQHVYCWSSPESPLNSQHVPTTVGVFVDYEKGEVLFCDADTGALFCSHAGCAFNAPSFTMRNVLSSLAGYPRRPKLYPIFGICESGDTLTITPAVT